MLSGLPFWQETDELTDSDDYLDNEDINDPMYADQSDAVNSKYRNHLALKVSARVSEEKKAKLKLL